MTEMALSLDQPLIPPAGLVRRKFKNHHLSVSRLKLYENCPRAFELRYIREAPTEGSTATDFGTCLHNVLERSTPDASRKTLFESFTSKNGLAWVSWAPRYTRRV